MWYWYAPKTRKVKGGIRSHSKRGDFGRSWWAKRWIKVLDGYDIGERMSRGRSYVRKGQVMSIDIQKGSVTATVQGSVLPPYKVSINIRTLSAAKWKKVTPALFARPATAARLLTGQMPEDIEKTFAEAGVPLFPSRRNDLETECDCYDWANPCKHIVAVYLLIGEELDRDPFLIFRLRGADRKEILDMAGLGNVDAAVADRGKDRQAESLPSGTDEFWGSPDMKEYDPGEMRASDVSAALPKWLGNFQFWRGKKDFMPSLEGMYSDASDAGIDALLGGEQEQESRTGKKFRTRA